MRILKEITIHGSVTSPDWMAGRPLSEKIDEIRRWHLARQFSDIGYHFVIDRDGKIGAGRPVELQGAGVKGQNAGKIHICLLGGRGGVGGDVFETHYTGAQDVALRDLIARLKKKHRIETVLGHNDHARTAYPQFQVSQWLAKRPTAFRTVNGQVDGAATGAGSNAIMRLIAWIVERLK